MRLSTAITLALTALLATSMIGAVAASPAASPTDPASAGSISTPAADQPALTSYEASQPAVSSTTATTPAATQPTVQETATPFEPADREQVIRINVSDSGNAEWTVETRYNLSDDDVEDFTEWSNAVAAGEREVSYDSDVQLFRSFAADAEQATDRSMTIESPHWNEPQIESPADDDTDADDHQIGVISYSFTWTNFAQADTDRIHVGDTFHEPDEPMFERLLEGQHLVIDYPDTYALETPTQLEWDGPHEFDDDELAIVFVRGPGGGLGQTILAIAFSGWGIGAGLLALAAVAVGYVVMTRRDEDLANGDTAPVSQFMGPVVAALPSTLRRRLGTGSATDETEPPRDVHRPPDEPAPAPTGESDDGTQIAFEEEEEIDPELLSDEERVHRMLKRNGGRMKQATIVNETGWSNAKVSQLLSQMDDDGKIEKLRIGRENLITLPEVDPTEVE
ncbi:hypothetical protein G6M89_14590 [Natronolimnobius sp. AArcel1]|uniref:helix-turn-helix transcriptional regulator n=1 Tax=Natronolimnobius sp. AArcel1 TaxID=1679093 RepID=UPI0013EB190C|nr:hypothetical protein [Natronolimnobius sp. AArcel1]NGM70222.1 hypothetical protein [Natronolimnobius sp. AArcel1]